MSSYLDQLPPERAHVLLFTGTFTWRIHQTLPTAVVTWERPGGSERYVSVSVKWHEPERRRSVADPPRGGTYTKLFALPVEGEDPCVLGAKEADAIIRSLRGG